MTGPDTGGQDVALTEAERARWDVDPDEWPHTPPYRVFRALMDEDGNTWWRAGSGHGLNAYEAACDEADRLTERLAAVEDYANLVTRIHEVYRHLVMDTADDRAIRTRHADKALALARAALGEGAATHREAGT